MFQTHLALAGMQPAFALGVFSELLRIPRRSGQEDGVVAMVQKWAKSHDWKSTVDEWKNVSVLVPGTLGLENAAAVTIQGHSDMVYVPNDDETVATAIDIEVANGFVQTVGQKRTLGADNGAAIALAMHVAETCTVHGPIEILITGNEEDSLSGAENWNPEFHGMTSRRLINVDTPIYGAIAVMSAGFQYVDAVLPLVRESEPAQNCYCLTLSGLLGGHSGDNVHEKRGNAIKRMGRLLDLLPAGSRIVLFTGGSAGNSIPAQSSVVVSIPDEHMQTNWEQILQDNVAHYRQSLKNDGIQLVIEPYDSKEPAFTVETHERVLEVIREVPNGVQTMSTLQEDLPELSTTLAMVRETVEGLAFKQIVRGAVEESMVGAANELRKCYQTYGCTAKFGHHSNSWTQEPGSPLVVAAQEAFGVVGTKAVLRGFHCGLELAALIGVGESRRFDSAVSIGALVLDEHAVTERMDLKSFAQIARVLELILDDIAHGKA